MADIILDSECYGQHGISSAGILFTNIYFIYRHFVKNFKLVVQAVTHTTHPSKAAPTFKFSQHVDEMSVGEILNLDKESVDKMSVYKESVDKMSVDKESVDKMSVDKESVDK